MATRSRRPVTVRTQAPRTMVHLFRHKVYGPTSTTTTTLDPTTGEVSVTTVQDTLRQQVRNLVKGSIIRMSSQRASYGEIPLAMYLERYPSHSALGEHVRVRINQTNDYYLYVVESVSPDGKFLSARRIISEESRYYSNQSGYLSHTMVVVNHRTENARPNADFIGPMDNVPSLEKLSRSIGGTAFDKTTTVTFHRTSHVTKVVDPTTIDPRAWAAVKHYLKANITAGMYDKLAKAVAHPEWRKWQAVRTVSSCLYDYKSMLRTAESAKTFGQSLSESIAKLRKDIVEEISLYGKVSESKLKILQVTVNRGVEGASRCGNATSRLTKNRLLQRITLGRVDLGYADCGHLHDSTETLVNAATSLSGTQVLNSMNVCAKCAEKVRDVQLRDGSTIKVHTGYVHIYGWSDGTVRVWAEPEIIGQRHSGKGVVGFVPSLVGAPRSSMLTCGIEIEVQAVQYTERNAMAHRLKKRITESNLLASPYVPKYWHMEHDGSTGEGGFEIVTGFTDYATHAKVLGAVFTEADGSNPWAGKLLGHDARGQACGIHVHVQKPTSLIHATKIRQFINAASSEKLIRAIARRYANSYCSYSSANAENGARQAVKVYKDHKRTYNTPKDTVRTALMRINSNSRYEAVNFQNSATVEFRMFRSSTKYQTIMACIEFSLAVWRFARETKAESMNTNTFLRFIERPEHRAETRNLRVQLKARGFDVAVPSTKKEAVASTETN